MNKKPTVHYRDRIIADVGLRAMVLPLDHQSKEVSNYPIWATTSRVLNIGARCFETENSYYVLEESVE